MKPYCLTIAGADPTSGAGIQADIRTFDRCGVYPFSVITAITFQSALYVYGFKSLSNYLEEQLEVIFANYPIKYVKIGMIPDVKTIDIIIKYIKDYDLFVVLDPITVSSSGKRLSDKGLECEIEKKLFSKIRVLTPNYTEALYYSGKKTNNINESNIEDLKDIASTILNKMYNNKENYTEEKAIVIKSAIIEQKNIIDLMLINKKSGLNFNRKLKTFKKKKIEFLGNIHGTGCVFSSAIAAYLSKGYSIEESINSAEVFFTGMFQKFIELPDQGKILD
ncbi:MAG: hydroxymethylpyrimidine/phosphomethylpyrimidine kinase, partial [Promethearchaeota archaeon]